MGPDTWDENPGSVISSWVTSSKLLDFSELLSPQGSIRFKELLYLAGQGTDHLSVSYGLVLMK